MYQLNFQRGSIAEFRKSLESASARIAATPHAKALAHLYNDTSHRDASDEFVKVIKAVFPDMPYVGCSTSGNISDGALVRGESPNISMTVNVFEDPTANVEVHQFPLTRDNRVEIAQSIIDLVNERPWVKAVEVNTTLIDVGMADFCLDLRFLRSGVVVFGGGALTSESFNMWGGLPYVFSSAGENSGASIALVLYGGESFNAKVETIYGWKPLGRSMRITRARGPILYELEGVPAFELFAHYLALENDEEFSDNSIVFPLAFKDDSQIVIKAPVTIGEDGSITLTSDLSSRHSECRITYGDPGTILRSIKQSASEIMTFGPQSIFAYSCAARRMYWGDDDISRETLPLQEIAPVAGFYTGGEFARQDGPVLHHNVTLVIACLREGEAPDSMRGEIDINEAEFTRQMGIVNRLAAFVGVTSDELETAYAKLEVMAKTDGLTKILNRLTIETHIRDAFESWDSGETAVPPTLIMLDLDNFKAVNDKFGHKAGDDVLKGLGAMLRSLVDKRGLGLSGRWGGEEFMVLAPDLTFAVARSLADELRTEFAAMSFPSSGQHTASVGLAYALPGESPDAFCQRVDNALYDAKRQGKNRVVIA